MNVSQAAALRGDGYRGRPSPHSPSEMFQGVTVLKAVKVCVMQVLMKAGSFEKAVTHTDFLLARTGGEGPAEERSSLLRPERESEEGAGVVLPAGLSALLLLLPPGVSLRH